MNREELRSRRMRALQRRHDAGLTDKIIGRAIGRHPDTVANWRTGNTDLSIGDMLALDEFFSSLNDFGLIADVCGDLAARRRQRADQLRQPAAQLEASAIALESEAA